MRISAIIFLVLLFDMTLPVRSVSSVPAGLAVPHQSSPPHLVDLLPFGILKVADKSARAFYDLDGTVINVDSPGILVAAN
jgi:hypothetical protein